MDWLLLEEFLRGTSLDIASFIFIVGIFYVMSALLVVLVYEIRINKIEKEKQREVDDVKKKRGVITSYVEASLNSIEEKYKYKLYHLNRKRKFILERLPFFKS